MCDNPGEEINVIVPSTIIDVAVAVAVAAFNPPTRDEIRAQTFQFFVERSHDFDVAAGAGGAGGGGGGWHCAVAWVR